MTISSQTRKTSPFIGNGVTTALPFAFKVFTSADVYLVQLDTATDVESVLVEGTDYTISLNANQNANPGGTATLTTALPTGKNVVITSDIALLQATDLTNNGAFYPEVINDALDRLTIITQQIQEQVSRAPKVPITSAADVAQLVSDVNILADHADDLNTVALISDDVQAVAAISAEVQTVAGNVADVTNFSDVYYGASVSDPSTRKDGSALEVGDLYFNTSANKMRTYSGAVWVDSTSIVPDASVTTAKLAQSVTDAFQRKAYSRFTAGGTSDAITGTLSPAITSYAAGLRVTTTPPGQNSSTTPTIALNGLSAITIKKRSITGAKIPLSLSDYNASGPFEFEYDGTDFVLLNPLPKADNGFIQIQPISASVASDALTLSLSPTTIDFRSETATSGTVSTLTTASTLSLVVPSGATLGTVAGVKARLMVLAINAAGVIEIAVINAAGGIALSETGAISTTAIGTGADSNGIAYSTTARTNVPYRIAGFVDITEATPGTWATSPTLVQGAGGQSLANVFIRSWQNVTASRAIGTVYYNTSGMEKKVWVSSPDVASGAGINSYWNILVNGTKVGISGMSANTGVQLTTGEFTVPPGQSYQITQGAGSTTLGLWSELG